MQHRTVFTLWLSCLDHLTPIMLSYAWAKQPKNTLAKIVRSAAAIVTNANIALYGLTQDAALRAKHFETHRTQKDDTAHGTSHRIRLIYSHQAMIRPCDETLPGDQTGKHQ